MHDAEPGRVRPLDQPGPPSRPLAPVVLLVALAAAVGAFLATAAEETAPPTTSPGQPPSAAGRLGLQAGPVLWSIDIGSQEVTPLAAGALDPLPWRVTIEDRRLSEVFYLGPDGGVDLEGLPGSVFAILLTDADAIAGLAMPAALVPIWSGAQQNGYDLVVARSAADAEWFDIVPLPGCGQPYPVAAPDARDVLHVWCTQIDEVRLLVEFPHRSTAAEAEAGHEALVVDADGGLWSTRLGTATSSEARGALTLEPGEMVMPVATLSRDGRILYMGLGRAEAAPGAPPRPDRVVAYDRERGTELWTSALPVPFETLVVASNGKLYAYYPGIPGDATGPPSALVEIDPADGSAVIVMSPLDLGTGRLLPLR